MFDFECVVKATEADKEYQEKQKHERELGIQPMSSTFDEWWQAKENDERETKFQTKMQNVITEKH